MKKNKSCLWVIHYGILLDITYIELPLEYLGYREEKII